MDLHLTVRAADGAGLATVERLLERNDLPTADRDRSPATFYLARGNGEAVGAAGLAVHGRAGLLRSVVVARDRRGEGVGTALCEHVEGRAAAAGVADLYLLTTTAAGFFADRGYDAVDRASAPPAVRASAEFDRLCPETATAMRKRLPADG